MQTPQSKIQETSQFVLSFKFGEGGGVGWGGLFKLGFQISQIGSTPEEFLKGSHKADIFLESR
jgi:hypothetical protein